MEGRGSFASRIGIVLATAGSAVGLGNIWRFPYMTGQNGGAAFILLYFCCVFLLGIPGMISEFIVGRHGETNAARAYDLLSRGKPWKLVGYLGILTATIILGFYAVVAGWCLEYLFASVMGKIQGDADYVQQYFQTFSSNPIKPCLWAVAFILITHIVVVRGIRNGIERASKLLMPALLILLVIIVIASCLLPGADKGIEFLLKPDFSKLSGSVFLEALGQAFFSLSLGTACLCTYASYFNKDTYLAGSAVQIALIDSMIAVMAGLMIFPAAFSVGVTPDAGPHEIGTAFFTEELHTRRSRSAWIVTAVCSLIAVFCALSIGACPSIRLLGTDLLDFCDRLTAQYLLPAGAFLTSLFIGWYVPRKVVQEEYTNKGRLRGTFFPVYLFIVRFVCPLCILLVFLHQLGVI